MKNNKSIFSTKLMLEGFRQCRTIGILALIIMSLWAILIPAGNAITYGGDSDAVIVKMTAEAFDVNSFMIFVIPAVAIMTLVLFHFLDNRASSDLYHALPHKRITVYLSFTASIILWAVLLIFASSLCSVVTCLILNKYIILLLPTVLPYMISMLLITLLVISGILVAINLTGTVFTNIVISGIILFLPRICFNIIYSAIFSNIMFISAGIPNGNFFANDSNLLFGLFSMMFGLNVNLNDIFHPEWYSIIYTFVLAVIYFAISGLLFCRRRSEAAGQSAPTRMHQHVYRIIITMAYCIIVTASLVKDLSGGNGFDAEDIFAYFVLYLVGAFIYLIYELITTKKWKNLITTLPGLGVVGVLCVGAAFGINAGKNHIINQCPKADEINSVSIGLFNRSYDDLWDYYDYVGMKNSQVEITDDEIISIMSHYLDENVITWKESENSYYNKYHNSGKYTSYNVTFNTDSGKLLRTVMIPNEDSDKILNIIETIPECANNYRSLPKPIDGTIYITGFGIGRMDVNQLSSEEAKNVFDIYSKELNEIDFKKLYNAYENHYYNYSINYTFSENGYTKEISCPIFSDIMPKTMSAYSNIIYNKQAEYRNDFENLINSGKYEYIDLDIMYDGNYNGYSYNGEELKELYSHLSKYIIDEPVKYDGICANIYLSPYDYNNNDSINFIVSLDKKILNDKYFMETIFAENYYYD